jgi:pantoate--beta-alanine ligase
VRKRSEHFGLLAVRVVESPVEARSIARRLPQPLGLVPTMGALHAGHLSLVERAVRENASVVASIFVNPLQFGQGEDFARYPRDFERDAAALRACGVDLLYAPSAEMMYPPGFVTAIDPGPVARGYEGSSRPGHFAGVATVVAKLLNTLEPARLYLGQKDAQQVAVLQTVVRDLDLPVEVVVVPTLRDEDGLALSSRNVYLSAEERAAAPSLHRALAAVASALAAGESDVANATLGAALLIRAPLQLEYLAVVEPRTFAPLQKAVPGALVIGAARAGTTRLIDNECVPARVEAAR